MDVYDYAVAEAVPSNYWSVLDVSGVGPWCDVIRRLGGRAAAVDVGHVVGVASALVRLRRIQGVDRHSNGSEVTANAAEGNNNME